MYVRANDFGNVAFLHEASKNTLLFLQVRNTFMVHIVFPPIFSS